MQMLRRSVSTNSPLSNYLPIRDACSKGLIECSSIQSPCVCVFEGLMCAKAFSSMAKRDGESAPRFGTTTPRNLLLGLPAHWRLRALPRRGLVDQGTEGEGRGPSFHAHGDGVGDEDQTDPVRVDAARC